jgi:hypothetical protein
MKSNHIEDDVLQLNELKLNQLESYVWYRSRNEGRQGRQENIGKCRMCEPGLLSYHEDFGIAYQHVKEKKKQKDKKKEGKMAMVYLYVIILVCALKCNVSIN